jgi:hypothetical protein
MMLLPLIGRITFSANWGKVWTTLGTYQANYSFGQEFVINDSIRAFFTPFEAMTLAYFLESCCVAFLGICVYLGNQLTGRPLGLWLAGGFVMLDITIYNIFPNWMNKFSPLALARLSSYTRSYYIPLNGSPLYGFLMFGGGIIAAMVLFCLNEGLRRDVVS